MNASRHKIFQIYYDSRTQAENDKGFLQLDNSSNERPDWSEYWPIRRYLHNNKLEDNLYYGFFSPKFKEKTGLDSTTVFEFLENSNEDVIVFSPFFDQSAFFINVFEQAKFAHPSIDECLVEAFRALDGGVDINNLFMTSRNTVFCNYFAAKRDFWEKWIACGEILFGYAEENRTPLGKLLNSNVTHSRKEYPAKVFAVERIVSFLMSTRKEWSARIFEPARLPYSNPFFLNYKLELIELDALKIAYLETGSSEYIRPLNQIRSKIISDIENLTKR